MRYSKSTESGKNPVFAAVLSFIIPGAGQIYLRGFRAGFLAALLWLVFVTLGYMFLFFPGILLHVICVFTAYSSASTSSSKSPIPGALLTVLVLFGGVMGSYYYFLPPEAKNTLSFISKALKNPDQLEKELNTEMGALMKEMEGMVSGERISRAIQQTAIEMLRKYAKAESEYKAAHGKYTRSTQALVDEGFLDLTLPETKKVVSGFYYGGYRFVHVKKQHTGYVDLKTGFVVSAAPITYKQTGIFTYVVGANGAVLSRDIQGKTIENTTEIDSSWKPVK